MWASFMYQIPNCRANGMPGTSTLALCEQRARNVWKCRYHTDWHRCKTHIVVAANQYLVASESRSCRSDHNFIFQRTLGGSTLSEIQSFAFTSSSLRRHIRCCISVRSLCFLHQPLDEHRCSWLLCKHLWSLRFYLKAVAESLENTLTPIRAPKEQRRLTSLKLWTMKNGHCFDSKSITFNGSMKRHMRYRPKN